VLVSNVGKQLRKGAGPAKPHPGALPSKPFGTIATTSKLNQETGPVFAKTRFVSVGQASVGLGPNVKDVPLTKVVPVHVVSRTIWALNERADRNSNSSELKSIMRMVDIFKLRTSYSLATSSNSSLVV
jgi:hypothetical protein